MLAQPGGRVYNEKNADLGVMTVGVEYELKYKASKGAQQAVREAFEEPWQRIAMETTYYDTADGALSARHYTLRRRMENGRSVCTLKTPLEGYGRGEWDTECGSIEKAIPILCKLGGPEDLTVLTAEGVEAVCGARFTRWACTVDLGTAVIELALDEGVLFGGGKEMPLCEIEVELKSGSREAATLFSGHMAGRYGLVPEGKSKFKRALDLRRGNKNGA